MLVALGACGVAQAPPTQFDGPDAFDRSHCQRAGWRDMALVGSVWSLDQQVPVMGAFAGIVRFDRDDDGNLEASYGGERAAVTDWTPDELFWRRAGSRTESARSFLACRRDGTDEMDGSTSLCTGGGCQVGQFHAVRLARRAGEGEASAGVAQVGEYGAFHGGMSMNVRVDAARAVAVLARYGDGLRLLALAPGRDGKLAIREIGHASPESAADGEFYNDVKLYEAAGRKYALAASSLHGAVIWDITDASAPVLRGHVRGQDNVHTLFVAGTTLYLANLQIGGLSIASIANPLAPVELGQYVLDRASVQGASFVHDLFVTPGNGRVYLDYWGAGLVIVDASKPRRPVKLGQYAYPRATNHSVSVTTLGGRIIALTGDEDFGAHARELDVTDPGHITLVGEWGQDRPQVSIHNILIEGDRAYVAYYQDGLRVLSLSASAAPVELAYFNTWRGPGNSFFEGAIGVDKVGGQVYLADAQRGLIVVEMPQ
jgi:hypothetical protein